MAPSIPERPAAAPETVAEEVADLLHRTAHRLRHAVRDELGPTEITPAQWRALRAITRCEGDPRMSDIADRLRIARRSATDVVDELEQRGLVARAADPTDRRAVVVSVTDDGWTLLRAAGRQRRQASARQLGALTEEELATLAELLRKLNADIDAPPPSGVSR